MNEGFGRHLWNVPLVVSLSEASLKVYSSFPSDKCSNILLQLGFISAWFSNVAYTFVKLTFFILYWIIFKPFRWMKFGIIGGAGIVIGFYFICIIISIIGDAPSPGHSWLANAMASHNTMSTRLSKPLAAWAIASDVFILLLPISGVLRLQLSPKRRFGLLMVFMTGLGYGDAIQSIDHGA